MNDRIRLARRHGDLSQAALADLVGVHRSAVSHWEATRPKRPNTGHLLAISAAAGIRFEWLATGNGPMDLGDGEGEVAATPLPPGSPADGAMAAAPGERELLHAFRAASRQSRAVMLELAQHLAQPGGHRRRLSPRPFDPALVPAEPLAVL